MAEIELHPDFKDLLRLFNSHNVEYLLVGGYAVGYHGYPRATGDMDVWTRISSDNAKKIKDALREFGMPDEAVKAEFFLEEDKVIRMGIPPVRIEILTGISGVLFDECFEHREIAEIDDIAVPLISLTDLKKNKSSAARHKDLEDIEHLP